jgi:hypothetical protein
MSYYTYDNLFPSLREILTRSLSLDAAASQGRTTPIVRHKLVKEVLGMDASESFVYHVVRVFGVSHVCVVYFGFRMGGESLGSARILKRRVIITL